ncbi:ubiquinone-dependent pyruvate dehydrogenase [Pseudomonas sp. PDNC002]|uniref:thiamine pyrophosphate-dependent enzyme n=1 Tax=Pseudomonas sp. PDNC002 TaxID=2811422 RepID=UPI001964F31D|nr:thiamine pyrophosphate-dependent enzyme [Pseudomonas sp. PDNC002]QRY82142.1 ubiquinone-dependent pyruvate dehydrogenase [Pseudomonas sp. PDNC002]
MSQTVAELMVDILHQAGARRCYGIPGDTLNHFTDALRRQGEIRWIHVRHEEVGGFAAGADALISDTLTLCAGSCGPGSLHFVNGLFESHRNGAPVVLIASQILSDEQGFDFPQEVDFLQVYRQCSVYCEQIHSPQQALRKTRQAVQEALNKRGVAVLVLPADIAGLPAPSPDAVGPTFHPRPLVRPADAELKQIAALLNSGRSIAIYGGVGCAGAQDAVKRLAGLLQAPIAHASRAKDFLEPQNPYTVGMIGMMGQEAGCHAVSHCDTLLILGSGFAWRQFYPAHATIIQIDLDSAHLGRRHPITLGAVGDIRCTVEALLPMITPRPDRTFLDHCLERHRKDRDSLAQRATPTHNGMIRPQYLTALIDRHANADALFTADGGSPMVWLLRYISARPGRRTLSSLVHGTMANAMPQALGLKVAFPERQVIALCGDGGLSMLLGDLLTLVQEKIPLKLVVFNNSALFFVELEQRVEGMLEAFTNLQNPDFGPVAQSIGLWGRKVTHCDELEPAIVDWLAQPGPALLDVVVDQELVLPPAISVESAKGMALYAAKAVISGHSDDLLTMIENHLVR